MPVNEKKKLETYAKHLIPVIKDFVQSQTEPLKARIKELETRLNEVELGGVKYFGTHSRVIDYKRGSMVTHNGSLWSAIKDCPQGKPGDTPDWHLVVKRGRDADRSRKN